MKNIKTKDGKVIENIYEYVSDWTNTHKNSEITIGCDSQDVGAKTNYITTVCMHEFGKGVHVLYCKEKEQRSKDMYSKLWAEVTKSVEMAELIKDINTKITIHVDYNSKQSEDSNVLYDAGIGYAKSKGYDAVGKPNAWAATKCADKYCRKK